MMSRSPLPPGTPTSSFVRELVRARKAPVPWDLAVITAIAVAVPVALVLPFMTHDPAILGIGVLAAMGALVASLADRGGPAVDRVRRIVTTSVFAAVGLLAGSFAFGDDVATVLIVVAAAFVSGVAGVISANASSAALQFLVYAIVGSGIDFGLRPHWLAPLVVLGGAAWRLALTGIAILADRRPRAPERAAVASVYTAVAGWLDAAGTPGADAARHDVTTALNQAYDLMVSARTSLAGRDPRWRELVTLLNAATPIVEAATAVAVEGEHVPPAVPNALRAVARAVENPAAPRPVMPTPDRSTPGRAALASSLRLVCSLLAGDDPVTMTMPIQRPDAVGLPRVTAGDRLRSLRDHLTSGGETWFAVLRLVLCVAVAEAVSVLLPLERPYWITLTVAVVMKPDFGSVFARAVQRGLGTVVGVLVGAAVVALLPLGWPQVLALAILAGGMPVAIRRNYGLFSVFITPVIVILLELAHGDDTMLILSRVSDTLIGCAIVLIVGYLPWPSTWRSARQLGGRVADVVDHVAGYLEIALAPFDADKDAGRSSSKERSAARRAAYRRLSDLRTFVQQTLAEPPPISTAAAAWWPQIVAMERVTDAVTSAAIRTFHSHESADPASVERLHSALVGLAAAIRAGRAPDPVELPDDDRLESVSDEVSAARALSST
jgi:uncharacterized membrane protein YccC